MKLSKKSKLTAILTVSVMFLAIIITASAIFAPSLYKDDDTPVSTTAYTVGGDFDSYQGYGYDTDLTVKFDNTNMGLTFANVEAKYPNTGVWIYYPTKIYMDVTENLKDLKYSFQYETTWGGVAKDGVAHALFYSALGYYLDGSNNQNGKYNTAWNADANMAKFFTDYSVKVDADESIGLKWGSNNVWGGATKKVDKNGNWNWKSDQGGGDGIDYMVTYYEGGKASPGDKEYTHIDNRMSGKPNPNNLGTYTYRRLAGTPLMIVGTCNSNWPSYNNGWQSFSFATSTTLSADDAKSRQIPANVRDVNDATGNDFVKVSTSNIPIYDDVIIEINTYDKAPLLDAMKALEAKFNAIKNKNLLLGSEQKRFDDMKLKVKNFIKKREVTQAQVNELKKEVEDYTFKVGISIPNLGTYDGPKSVTYTGGEFTLANIW